MLTLGLFKALSESILQAFYGIMLLLDSIIYGLISKLYEIFTVIASAKIFTSDLFTTIANRIYVVIGVITLFFLAYSLLRAIVNPDNFSGDKGVGKLLPNVAISIILIALVPTIFNYVYKIQNVILDNNIIGKIVIGNDTTSENVSYNVTGTTSSGSRVTIASGSNSYNSDDIQKGYVSYGGKSMALLVFEAFFYTEEDESKVEADGTILGAIGYGVMGTVGLACAAAIGGGIAAGALSFGVGAVLGIASCIGVAVASYKSMASDISLKMNSVTLLDAKKYAAATGDFSIFTAFATDDMISSGTIHYSWFLSTITGILICYLLLSFCIDLGVRVVKLGYYQIIAPIPILYNILPSGKKVFDKWVKGVISTFVMLFIRIFIIYLAVLLIQHLPSITSSAWGSVSSDSTIVRLLARAFIILGILIFAKQAPKMISELFGVQEGDMKFGLREKFRDSIAPLRRPTAALMGGIHAGVRGFNGARKEGGSRRGNFVRGLGGFMTGAAGGAMQGFSDSKDAKSFKDVRDAASKAAQETEDKKIKYAAYKAEHADEGVIKGRITDAIEGAKKWAGAGITLDTRARLQVEERNLKMLEEFESKRAAAYEQAGKVMTNNKSKVIFRDGYQTDAEYMTAVAKALRIQGASDEVVLESLGLLSHLQPGQTRSQNDIDNAKRTLMSLSYADWMQIRDSRKNAAGENLSPLQASGIADLIENREVATRNNIVAGKTGVDSNGAWTYNPADVKYDDILSQKMSDLQKTIVSAVDKLGKDHAMFQKDSIKAFMDENKDLSKGMHAAGVTINDANGNPIDLAKLFKDLKKDLREGTTASRNEVNKIRQKIEEAEKDKDKK